MKLFDRNTLKKNIWRTVVVKNIILTGKIFFTKNTIDLISRRQHFKRLYKGSACYGVLSLISPLRVRCAAYSVHVLIEATESCTSTVTVPPKE